MSNEFVREERYIVFKMSDLGNSLKGDEIRRLAREYAEHRQRLRKKPLECVVVEKDWPEYEATWKAIEARVTGAQNALEESAVQTAARIMNIELIRECDALRAKIAEMEKRVPAALVKWQVGGLAVHIIGDVKAGDILYALPGAKGEGK